MALTIKFTKEKDTPNTVRYAEVVPDDDVKQVGVLYVQKHAAKALGFPETLTVTIEAA